jgi:hypothetical protein
MLLIRSSLVGPLLGLTLLLADGWTQPVRSQVLVTTNSVWAYRKGTNEASVPATAWRQPGFDDSTWTDGAGAVLLRRRWYAGNTACR